MSKNLAPAADTNEPVDLDADLTEFEQYARDHMPKVSPKSPYYRIEERQYHETAFVTQADLIATLFRDVEVPAWHYPDNGYSWNTPSHTCFVSDEYTVRLRRERGSDHGGGDLQCAKYITRLIRPVLTKEPTVECWLDCVGTSVDDDGSEIRGRVKNSLVKLTLDEAVEVAHLLLLLVDVARDTTAVQE